jgi:hypothetical protein
VKVTFVCFDPGHAYHQSVEVCKKCIQVLWARVEMLEAEVLLLKREKEGEL